MDWSPPDFSVHGILQARILEWVASSFSRGIFLIQGSSLDLLYCRQILYRWATWKAHFLFIPFVKLILHSRTHTVDTEPSLSGRLFGCNLRVIGGQSSDPCQSSCHCLTVPAWSQIYLSHPGSKPAFHSSHLSKYFTHVQSCLLWLEFW